MIWPWTHVLIGPPTLVKIPVPYQCPFCTETVLNGLFSSPAVPDQYLWIPGGNSSQFSIGAGVPKLYPAQLERTAVLPRNRLGTPVTSTRATAAALHKQLRNGDLSWPVPLFTRQEAAIRNALRLTAARLISGFYHTEKLGLIFQSTCPSKNSSTVSVPK